MTSKLDGQALRANRKRILALVNSLATKNKQSRTKLLSLYKTNKTKINTEEREKLATKKKQIRSDATNAYNSELEKIQSDSQFQTVKQTKSTSSSTKKSTSSSSKSSTSTSSKKSSSSSSKKSSSTKSSSTKSSNTTSNKEYNARMEAGHKTAAANYARWQKERAALKNKKK